MFKRIASTFVAAAALLMVASPPTSAQSVAEFYKGRTMKLLIGAGAGGTFNLYGQLLAANLGDHIPGKPSFVVKHMPGGGGRKVANYMHNAAPKDGTVLAITIHTVPISQLIQTKGINYDVAKWNWLGNMAVLVDTIAVWHTAPAMTFEDTKKNVIIVGGTGRAGPMSVFPLIVNQLLGSKFKVIDGYKSVGGVDKVLESGEVQGRGGSYLSWTLRQPQWLKDGKVRYLIQMGQKKHSAVPANVPVWTDLAKSADDRAAMMFLASSSEISRAIFLPPGVPKDRVAALRRAFDATMNDSVFRADAKKRGLPIQPLTGAEVEAKVAATLATPAKLVARVKQLRLNAIKRR